MTNRLSLANSSLFSLHQQHYTIYTDFFSVIDENLVSTIFFISLSTG